MTQVVKARNAVWIIANKLQYYDVECMECIARWGGLPTSSIIGCKLSELELTQWDSEMGTTLTELGIEVLKVASPNFPYPIVRPSQRG
jgi:hypothetical protein